MTLPNGWSKTSIEDVAEVIRGVTYDKSSAAYAPNIGLVPIVRATNIQSGFLNRQDLVYVPERFVDKRQMLRKGDVVIATSSGSRSVVGKAAQADHEHNGMSFGAFCSVVRPRDEEIRSWLARVFETLDYRSFVESVAIGTNINNLRIRDLSAYRFQIPPLTEQHRIVAKLTALTTRLAQARTELNRIPLLAARLKRATLSKIFSEESDKPVHRLGEFLHAIEAGKNLKCDERVPSSSELGVLKVSAISSEVFRADQAKTLPKTYAPPSRHKICQGDLLLARASGSLSLVGRVALVQEEPNNLYLSDKVLRLVLPSDLKLWIYWFLRSPAGRGQIEEAATGISMHNITQDSLRRIRMPLPDVQERHYHLNTIETTFARADLLELEAERARALLDRLEAAILAKAFRGELVPQDPSDEPTSVLLERIRAQHAETPKQSWSRRTPS